MSEMRTPPHGNELVDRAGARQPQHVPGNDIRPGSGGWVGGRVGGRVGGGAVEKTILQCLTLTEPARQPRNNPTRTTKHHTEQDVVDGIQNVPSSRGRGGGMGGNTTSSRGARLAKRASMSAGRETNGKKRILYHYP